MTTSMFIPELVLAAIDMSVYRHVKRVLTNVEFIALKMQSHPGQSGRFYRRALNMYKDPVFFSKYPDKSGDDNAAYFLKSRGYNASNYHYPGRLWVDSAVKSVKYNPWMSEAYKPRKSSWNLTKKGWDKANVARVKLGLETIPWSGK